MENFKYGITDEQLPWILPGIGILLLGALFVLLYKYALVHPDAPQYAPELPDVPFFIGHYGFDNGTLDIESFDMIRDGERKVKITISFNGTRFNQLLRTESQEFGLEEEHNMVDFVSRALEAFFTEDFLRYQH